MAEHKVTKDMFIYQMCVAGLAGLSILILAATLLTVWVYKAKLRKVRSAVSSVILRGLWLRLKYRRLSNV